MKWTKRTAALLAALLLLGTIARARGASKAASPSREMTSIIQMETEGERKMPSMPVLPKEAEPPAISVVTLEEEKPSLPGTAAPAQGRGPSLLAANQGVTSSAPRTQTPPWRWRQDPPGPGSRWE